MSENGSESRAADRRREREEVLRRVIQPVREQVAEIDEQLTALQDEMSALRAERAEAMKILRLVDPEQHQQAKSTGRAKTSATMQAKAHERALQMADRIETLLRTNPNGGNEDGEITRKWISEQIEGLGMHGAKAPIQLLLDAGVLRVDRKTRGGGIAYALTS